MPGDRLRVLVVEDSAAMRSFVTAALEQGGPFDVVSASSGFEALRVLPRGQFDVIITDINMPDINGLELVRFVRDSERHKQTPLVLISTDSRAVDRERGLKLGANAYVVKPFEPPELLAVVERVVKRG
jgi:two-component system chemotaxis response regulator CheY